MLYIVFLKKWIPPFMNYSLKVLGEEAVVKKL